MKYGTFLGIIMLVIGAVLGIIGFTMLGSTGSTLRIFFAGPTIAAIGLGMIIFPGADISLKEGLKNKELQRKFFSMSPRFHIVFWIIFGAAALIVSFIYLF